MENVTKALGMTAGVLIAIMIIALLYSFITTLSKRAEQEDLDILAEQTEKINAEYEAFDKKLMRGTDLITVVNKALANNERYKDQENIYDIDIIFTLKEAVTEIKIKVSNGKATKAKTDSVFGAATSYSIIRDEAIIRDFMQLGTYQTTDSYQIVKNDNNTPIDDMNYTKIYDGFTVFKRKFFRCKKIDYSNETGRINKLEFVEVIPVGGTLEGYN